MAQRGTTVQASARESWARHVAISLATLGAFFLREELHVSPPVLAVLAGATVLNFVGALLLERPNSAALAAWLSPCLCVAAWAALVFFTGGSGSPFVAGLLFEVVASALHLDAHRVPFVTLIATGALWVQELILGFGPSLTKLWVETAFIAAIGSSTYVAVERAARTRRSLSRGTLELSERLRDLGRELEDARALASIGEGAARFAHAATNAVHALRGFVRLAEDSSRAEALHGKALQGLSRAIDRLDELSRATLQQAVSPRRDPEETSSSEVARTLEQLLDEVRHAHPTMRWVLETTAEPPALGLPRIALYEVLWVLLRNAAEASGARGEVLMRVDVAADRFSVMIRDSGPGIAGPAQARLFHAGRSTKASGNGFGLFLARRLVESSGGELTACNASGGGALFVLSLPARTSRSEVWRRGNVNEVAQPVDAANYDTVAGRVSAGAAVE